MQSERAMLLLVEKFIALGADLERRDLACDTPLINAVRRGQCAIVERLLAAGAAVDACDAEGETPFDACGQEGSMCHSYEIIGSRRR